MDTPKMPLPARSDGFTLVEVVVTIVIVGLVFVAAGTALTVGTRANAAATDMTQAGFLAREAREWTVNLPFRDPDPWDADSPPGADSYYAGEPYIDDVDDLLSASFQPPRDSEGDAIPGMAAWSQHFTLTWRSPSDLSQTVTPGNSDIIYVNLSVRFGGEEIGNYGWIITDQESLEDD